MKRLAVGLALAVALEPGVMSGGLWGWLFPWAFLLLLLERGADDDRKTFLLGAAFALAYEGAYLKELHNGFAFLGVSWFRLLAAPLEWGVVSVLWLHVLDAAVPRRSPPAWWLLPATVPLGLCAGAVYGVRLIYDHFPAWKYLSPLWLLYDGLFVAAAVLAPRLPAHRIPPDGEPVRADRVALAALGFHTLSALLPFSWVSISLDVVSKLLFGRAFLTRRLRV